MAVNGALLVRHSLQLHDASVGTAAVVVLGAAVWTLWSGSLRQREMTVLATRAVRPLRIAAVSGVSVAACIVAVLCVR
ncbi:hypothetical protein LP417_18380 [Polaromonas sp. P1-6]|nr:hypothetical protein LP417_18380 [Polaromonas sp. P1-6]